MRERIPARTGRQRRIGAGERRVARLVDFKRLLAAQKRQSRYDVGLVRSELDCSKVHIVAVDDDTALLQTLYQRIVAVFGDRLRDQIFTFSHIRPF